MDIWDTPLAWSKSSTKYWICSIAFTIDSSSPSFSSVAVCWPSEGIELLYFWKQSTRYHNNLGWQIVEFTNNIRKIATAENNPCPVICSMWCSMQQSEYFTSSLYTTHEFVLKWVVCLIATKDEELNKCPHSCYAYAQSMQVGWVLYPDKDNSPKHLDIPVYQNVEFYTRT